MSTRATYQFQGCDFKPTLTLYVHHDGYPEGAANYFKQACVYPNARGGLAERFLRANDNAELTRDHAAHCDTEYRYTLGKGYPSFALKAEQKPHNATEWRTFYTGDLIGFISQYLGETLIPYPGQWLTQDMAHEKLNGLLDQTNDAIKKGWTGNASSYNNDAWKLLCEIAVNWGKGPLFDHYLAVIDTADAYFAKAYGWASQQQCSDEEALVLWQAAFRKGRQELILLTAD